MERPVCIVNGSSEPAVLREGGRRDAAARLLEDLRSLGPFGGLCVLSHVPGALPDTLAIAGTVSPALLEKFRSLLASGPAAAAVYVDGGVLVSCRVGDPVLGAGLAASEDGCSPLLPPGAEALIRSTLEALALRESLERAVQKDESHCAQMQAMLEIGQAAHTLPAQDLLELVCRKAAGVMKADACSLMLTDHEGELVIRASFGLPPEVVESTHLPRGTGIAWHVVESGQPAILNESPSERIGDVRVRRRSDIQSSMCVPLRSPGGPVTGVLSIRRMKPARDFTPDDLTAFTLFANQAAMFIAHARLYDHLQRRIQELSTVNRLTAAINATLDLDYVLSQIAECVIEDIGFDRCAVYLLDERTGRLQARAARGFSPGQTWPASVEPGDSVLNLAAREQVVILAEGEDLENASRVSGGASGPARGFVAAPIVVRRRTIGVIAADNLPSGRPIGRQEHVDLLATLGSHAGLAIENSSLYQAMEQKYAELNVLYELSRTIGSAYGLQNAVTLLLEVAMKAVPADSAAFVLLEENDGGVEVLGTLHADPENPVPWQICEQAEAARLLAALRDPLLLEGRTAAEQAEEWWKAFEQVLEAAPSLLLIPLIADGRTIGVLLEGRGRSEPFVSHDVKLLSIVASNASVVIRNAARYERRMREKVLELSALYELSQRISTAANLDEALASIVAIVRDLVESDECFIWTVDPESGALQMRSGQSGGSPGGYRLARWAVHERKAVVLPDVQKDVRFAEVARDPLLRSVMAIPLMVQDEVVGVLSVHSRTPNIYSEDQLRVLSVIASQAAAIYRGLEALTALTSYTDNILTSVPAGVVTLDSAGRVVSWNRAAEEILGVEAASALGAVFTELMARFEVAPAQMASLEASLARVLDGGAPERGVTLTLKNGPDTQLHLSLSSSQLRNADGEPLGLVIVFEDMTRQVRMQEEVRRMGELAAIGQLAASIAHELRNPLSSIKGAAQFLSSELSDPADREFLNIIIEEVDGLNRIASEFLDFARPLKLEVSEVRPSELLDRGRARVASQLTEAGIECSVVVDEGTPSLLADARQLEQVLLNLILNAVQAMPEGGTLELGARRSASWRDCVELWVRDTGCGIPAERLERIFTPFFTTKVKGTGLGLPVVQKIVQNHGGHIAVESVEGEGSVFRIHLPVGGPAPSLLQENEPPAPDLMERA